MKRRRLVVWGVFAGCVAAGTALLAWLTKTMVELERAETRARAHAQHEVAMGTALWQMDAWLLPLLTAEAQRPADQYQAFNPVQHAYTNLFNKVQPGEVVAPSPLLTFRSEYFPLHFQIDTGGKITSPQVPEGNELDVAQSQEHIPDLAAQRELLRELRRVLSPATLRERCSIGLAALPEAQIANRPQGENGASAWLQDNYSQRAQVTRQARQTLAAEEGATPLAGGVAFDAGHVDSGPLVPFWLDFGDGRHRLAFVRRSPMTGGAAFQGVLADWDALQSGMIAQIRDEAIARCARLERVDSPDAAEQPHLLTVLPAVLIAPPPEPTPPGWTPVRWLLAIAWLALLGTAGLAATTLHATLAFGDRRARFASAVTHELRTPLTTFRMYSEMLATGMVPDPARQKQYLRTLQSESDRLARLVENVLGFTRIEEGRFSAHVEPITATDLVARLRPLLARRVADAGCELQVDVADGDVVLNVDTDAVGQILFNLVDNACKYGEPPLRLSTCVQAGQAVLRVHDAGPGVPRAHRRRIFAAFDRGARRPGDNELPGVGLGLALARGLARDLGGDLVLADAERGACFELRLPAALPPRAANGPDADGTELPGS